MTIKISRLDDRLWFFFSLIGFGVLYLNLTWKTTENIDLVTTSCLFWAAIIWLFWQKCDTETSSQCLSRSHYQDRINCNSDPVSSFIGLFLLGVVLFKTLSLFWFESALLFLLPCLFTVSLILIFFGIKNILKYAKELFFAGFLFFPTAQFESVIQNLTKVTVIIAKLASYLLYYFGFDVVSQGNQVLLSIPDRGEFRAIVNYPCAGLPMVMLNLKLALLLISIFSLPRIHRILAPLISVGIGLILGTIRVSIMTLAIPNPARFDYWHGTDGSQIFSTIGMALVFTYWYWVMQQQETSNDNDTYSKTKDLSNVQT
ncbi:MAG: hypothetical protein Tsb0014_21200 [Pleurocapsa sp.]